MRALLTIVSFLTFVFPVLAQDVDLKGKVRDAESKEPLEFANVALLDKSDSSVVAGGMSDIDGTFNFVAQPGDYILKVGFIGYDGYYKEVSLGDKRNVNFGNIELLSGATGLDEVTVEGVTSIFESDIDKRRYDVENSVVAEGATASELLETLPSIQVDDEGGITMRGSGDILIYINGRPSNLSGDDAESILEQFPANSIKSVELITNPSSRYDAAGVGGIINIILKKNEKTGLNGQANISVGTRDKYNAGINVNYGAGRVNYYASYNYQNRRTFRESEAFRENFIPGISQFLDQDSYGERVDITHLIRGGFDYNVTDKGTLGFYAQGNFRDRTSFNRLNQRNLNTERGLDSLYVRDQDDVRQSFNFETGLNYDWEIDTLGQKLFTSLSYSRDERVQTEEYEQSFFNPSMEEVPANYLLQINDRPQTSDLYVFQLDYVKPFENGGELESGLKGTFSLWDREQDFFQGDQGTEFQPVMIDTLSNSYRFKEDVYAGYFAYRNTLGKFGYQGGLRAEYTETIGFAGDREAAIVNNYFNLFPSMYLSYDMGEEQEFSANYSRRISRPNLWSLSPIYRVRDLLNLSIGNPFLQPEFTDSYEFGYMKGWERYLMNATVYHRASTNVLTRVIRLTDENIAIQTRENAARRNSTGFEIVNQLQINNWWDATVTGNFFYSEIFGDNIEEGFNNSNFSWTVNLLSSMAIPNLFTLQVQGNYRGPIVFPQGELEPFWGINAGIRKNLFNDNATITLNVSDIFNTRIFRIRNDDQRFVQDRMFNRETRIGTIAFTWRFGGFRDRNGRDDRGDRDFDDDDSDF
ncbi:TonB-dependent receptor domain-containing protein [Pleomorphovibrio marinus]|uniref:TonB-dependent receptor domain-containing protein n=1 Tax=Pleomorphovibrio marinus TaxID=2164132 RepID=UPI000E0BFCFB|nr:TonB-dependent receptor [Pleomorphovibrio marinus]